MSTTRMNTRRQDGLAIGDLDEVALLRAVDGWPIGTTGTVIAASSACVTIEISGYLSESLDFIEVPVDDLRLIRKCSQPDPEGARSRRTAAGDRGRRPMAIGEHDVVALRAPIEGWPEGTSGTVVDVRQAFVTVEISNHLGESLALLDLPSDQLRVTRRTACRGAEVAVD
jgi:hypothetical protein